MRGSARGKTDAGSFIVDRRGTVLGFDEAMERLTGWPAIEIVGRNKEISPRGGEGWLGPAAIPLYEGQIDVPERSRTLPLQLNRRDGRQLEVEAMAERLEGPGDRVLVTALRVVASSPGRTHGDELLRRDPLTGLLNAAGVRDALERAFDRAARTARPLALILADVDQLRTINDRFGREAGDEVLQKLAGIFRVAVGDETRLGRLTDDDFAIVMPNAGRGEARQLAASLRSTVERYRFLGTEPADPDPRITLSLGAASFPADADSEADLAERAREALDQARSMGRNRVWCYLRRPRVPLQVPVYFDGLETLLVGYTRDLSPSGLFVQTAVPIEIGMRCALTFPLPGQHEPVHVIARVVRTVPTEALLSGRDTHIPGMGIEFERFGGSRDRRAIETFLHAHESTSLRPETGMLSV